MRNTEERVLAVKLRAQELELKNCHRNRQLLKFGSVALSFVIILGLSYLIPTVMETISDGNYGNLGTFASIFEGSNFLGYVLIGVLAFSLGVSATILSYKIKTRSQLPEPDKESRDD